MDEVRPLTIPDHALIDSSVWIPLLRGTATPSVRSRVAGLIRSQVAATAGPIILEVQAGAVDDLDFQRIKDEFMALSLVPTLEESWREAARLQFALRRKGVAVPHMDALIATLAIESDCVLLHADRHFDLIARHSRLRAERLG